MQVRPVVDGLEIRRVRRRETNVVLGWVGDPTFRGDFLWFSKASRNKTIEGVRKMLGSGDPCLLGVEKPKSHQLIGLLLYRRPEGFDYFEVGFYLVPSERGKGYGPHALSVLVGLLFKKNRIETIVAGTSSLNVASQRALERVGFKRVGVWRKTLFRRGKWEDSILYAIYRNQGPKAPSDGAQT